MEPAEVHVVVSPGVCLHKVLRVTSSLLGPTNCGLCSLGVWLHLLFFTWSNTASHEFLALFFASNSSVLCLVQQQMQFIHERCHFAAVTFHRDSFTVDAKCLCEKRLHC